MILLQQMLVLFLIMMIGFFCNKIHMITKEGNRVISALVVNVANPALVLSSVINTEFPIESKELALTFLIAICMYLILLIVAEIIPRILRIPASEFGIYKIMTVFSNIGFMGFPLLAAMYGPVAVLYASIFTLPYNVLIYTYGIHMIVSGDSASPSITKITTIKDFISNIPWKKICNVGVISCVVAIILFFMKPQVPVFIDNAIDRLASLTAPLSMLVIGDSMANIKLKEFVTDTKLLIFTTIKLLLLPFFGMLLIKQLGLSPLLTGVCLVMLATPVGSMTAMLSNQYDVDSDLASKGVALTTLLAVITMPLVSFLVGV